MAWLDFLLGPNHSIKKQGNFLGDGSLAGKAFEPKIDLQWRSMFSDRSDYRIPPWDLLVSRRANKSPQPTRNGVSNSAIVEHVIRPACLSFGR